jgi:hypothetical protein
MERLFSKLLYAQIDVSNKIDIPRPPVDKVTVDSGLQILFGVTGGIALLVITVAGFRYVISRGDPQSTARAKDTILYAVIGLVVSIMAFGIVSFVVNKL